MLTAGTTPAGGGRRTADGRTPRRTGGHPGGRRTGGHPGGRYAIGGIHVYAMGEGGYGRGPIGEAGKIYQHPSI
jgi:hypothetical protein